MEAKGAIRLVKGVSRQVIVVHSPDKKLFEQAIFILREDAPREGLTDEMLLREAKRAAAHGSGRSFFRSGFVWGIGGSAVTALVWLLTTLL